MRNFGTLFAVLVLAACEAGPRELKEPPVLTVTSPARSLVQDHAGQLVVTGTVAPNSAGDPIAQVLVNNVPAAVSNGAFTATIQLREGATLIHTEARDVAGGLASDTRAAQAGQLRAVGTNVASAVTAALSTDAFTKLSAAAGPLVKSVDLAAMLAPLQPMAHFDDPNGPDCFYAQLFIDKLSLSDVHVSLIPVAGGLAFRAELDGLALDSHANYSVACIPLSTSVGATADKVVVAGTLNVTPDGMSGFNTVLVNPDVELTNLDLDVSGLPGKIIDGLHLETAIQPIIAKAAELAMNPLVNTALGALAGPQQLDILGKQLTLQVAPSALTFTPDGAVVTMNMSVLLAGTESSRGYIYTNGSAPEMDASAGFAVGIADDLANEMLAEVAATGLLELELPTPGGAFDTAHIHMTLPPMLSANTVDGNMHVVLGDLITTFTVGGKPVAKAAINATVDLKIAPLTGGAGIALQLGTPEVHIDVLDDVPNTTGLSADQLSKAASGGLVFQVDTISKLLRAIPVPAIAGLQVRDLSIGGDDGYVMVRGRLD